MSEINGNNNVVPIRDDIQLPPSFRRRQTNPGALADLLAEALAAYQATERVAEAKVDTNASQITDVIPMLSALSDTDSDRLTRHITEPEPPDATEHRVPNAADSLAMIFCAQPEPDGTVPVRGVDLDWLPGQEESNWMTTLLSNVIEYGGYEQNGSIVMHGNIKEELLPNGFLGVTAVKTAMGRREYSTGITLYGLNASSTWLYGASMTVATNQQATYSTRVSRYRESPYDIDPAPALPQVLRPASIGQLSLGYFCVTELYNRDLAAKQEALAPNYTMTCYQRWRTLKSLGMPVLPPPDFPIPL